MNQFIEELKPEYEKVIAHLKEELASLRTGRAHPSLVENIVIEAYGAKVPLKRLASLTVADAKTIIVQPWDNNLMVEIEKAISQSDKGLSVYPDKNILRLVLPALSEETRKKIVKVLHEILERARIALREIRDKKREKIFSMFKNKEITEDDKFRQLEDLDKLTSEYTKKIKEIGENKEKEIMTV